MQNNNFNNINNNDKYAYGAYFMITKNSFDEKIEKQINKQTENKINEINALVEKINSYLNNPGEHFQDDVIFLLNKDENKNIKISPLNYYKYVVKRIIAFMNEMTQIMSEYDYYINQKVYGDASIEKKFELLKAHFVIYKDLHEIIRQYTTKIYNYHGYIYMKDQSKEFNKTSFENEFLKSLNLLYEKLTDFKNKIQNYKKLTNLFKSEDIFFLNSKNSTDVKIFEDNSYYDALKNFEKNPNSSYENVVMPKINNNIINNSNNSEKDSKFPYENVVMPKINNNINNSNDGENFFEETNSKNSNFLNKKTERSPSNHLIFKNSDFSIFKFLETCGFKNFLCNVEGKILNFSYKNENLKRKMGYSLNLKEFEQEINELINEMKKIIESCFKNGEFNNSGKLTNNEAERKIDELKISIFTKFQNFEKPFSLFEKSANINLTNNNLNDNFDDYLFNNNNINNLKSKIKPSDEKESEDFSLNSNNNSNDEFALNLNEIFSDDSNDLESSFSNLNKNNNSSNEFNETMNSFYDIYKTSILTNDIIKNLNVNLEAKILDLENRYYEVIKKAKNSLKYNEFKEEITKLNEKIINTFNKHFKNKNLKEKIKEVETLLNNKVKIFENLLKELKKDQNKK